MKNLRAAYAAILAFVLPTVTFAANGLAGSDATGGVMGDFLSNVLKFINNIVIPAILAIGFLLFAWGIFQYFIRASDEAKETGKNLILYTVIGFVVILSFWGIVNLFADGLGLNSGTTIYTPKAGTI